MSINKMWYIYIVYSAINRKDALPYATMWRDLGTLLKEEANTKYDLLYGFIYLRVRGRKICRYRK